MNYKFKENEIININSTLRLRIPSTSEWNKALEWYSNKKVLYYSEGIPLEESKIYEMDTINRMYTYLNKIRSCFLYRNF